jgi:hypothetical protein
MGMYISSSVECCTYHAAQWCSSSRLVDSRPINAAISELLQQSNINWCSRFVALVPGSIMAQQLCCFHALVCASTCHRIAPFALDDRNARWFHSLHPAKQQPHLAAEKTGGLTGGPLLGSLGFHLSNADDHCAPRAHHPPRHHTAVSDLSSSLSRSFCCICVFRVTWNPVLCCCYGQSRYTKP